MEEEVRRKKGRRKKTNRKCKQRQIIRISHMHTYIQRQDQQVNRRHIKITYLLTAPEPARGGIGEGKKKERRSHKSKIEWPAHYYGQP